MFGLFRNDENRQLGRKNRHARRTAMSFMLMLVTLVSMFPNATFAEAVAPHYMVGKTGSIDLKAAYKKKPLDNGTVAIYTVGIAADDGIGNQFFDITKGKFQTVEEVKEIPTMDTATLESKNAAISKVLEKLAASVTPDATAKFNSSGEVSFSNLPTGIYFVRQTDYSEFGEELAKISAFLVTIPDGEGNLAVNASPKPNVLPVPGGDNPPDEPPTEKPPKDTPPGGNTPPKENPPSRLPQTGQLWWPVPFLGAAGILFLLLGLLKKMKAANLAA